MHSGEFAKVIMFTEGLFGIVRYYTINKPKINKNVRSRETSPLVAGFKHQQSPTQKSRARLLFAYSASTEDFDFFELIDMVEYCFQLVSLENAGGRKN